MALALASYKVWHFPLDLIILHTIQKFKLINTLQKVADYYRFIQILTNLRFSY